MASKTVDVSSKTGSGTGKAPKGLPTGTTVKTDAGTYKITGVKSDGTYTSEKVPSSGGGGNGGGNSSHGSNNSAPPIYNINSPDGHTIAQNLLPGQSQTVGDGSTWTKNDDGSITVVSKNGTRMNTNYGPTGTVAPTVNPNEWAMTDQTVQQNPLLTGNQLANLYGVTYDYDTIMNKLNDAVSKKYTTLENDYKQNENTFYDSLFGLQGDALTNLKTSRGSAIANGASAGVASANELLTMLGLGQQASTLATTLTQEKQQLSDKKAADTAQAKADALTYANQAGVNLGTLASQFNAADTQFSVGAMDAIARIQQANADLAASQNYSSNQGTAKVSGNPSTYQSGSKTQYNNINDMVAADDFWSWASTMGLSTNLTEATKQWNALGKYTPAQKYAAQQKAREGTIDANKNVPTSNAGADPLSPNSETKNTTSGGILRDRQGRRYRFVNGRVVYIDQ